MTKIVKVYRHWNEQDTKGYIGSSVQRNRHKLETGRSRRWWELIGTTRWEWEILDEFEEDEKFTTNIMGHSVGGGCWNEAYVKKSKFVEQLYIWKFGGPVVDPAYGMRGGYLVNEINSCSACKRSNYQKYYDPDLLALLKEEYAKLPP